MAAKAAAANALFRPHFKTHQSGLIGNWFRQVGISSITVSSVAMAAYFARHGWDDICIAFPVNLRELDEINKLAQRIKLHLLVESPEVVDALGNTLKSEVGIYIKIDSGAGRTGIHIKDTESVKALYNKLLNYPQLIPAGLLTHAGHTYHAKGEAAISEIAGQALEGMDDLRKSLSNNNLLLSWGDTPSCAMLENLSGFDEWRPGNFVFYDIMQYHIGAAKMEDIAVALACPVVALHPDRGQVIVHGGAVHLSKDFIEADNGFRLYGYVVRLTDNGWQAPITGAWVGQLSQEHGIINMPESEIKKFKVGDVLGILPVHSCLTVSCMKELYTLQGKYIPCLK